VKKITGIIGIILLVVFVFGVVVLESSNIQNFIFYKTGLTSKDIFALNDKINLSSPEDSSKARTDLLGEIDSFMESSVKGTGFSQKPYDLIKIRLDKALTEIPKTVVAKGKVKVWYIYDMGLIVKSDTATIGFDLASTAVYGRMKDFTKYIDVLITSHYHNDHFDLPVVREALKNGVTVIGPDDTVSLLDGQFFRSPDGENVIDLIKKRNGITSDNFYGLTPFKETVVKGVKITAYPANHMYNPENDKDLGSAKIPAAWYYVSIADKTFLFTGDSNNFDQNPDFAAKKVDVFVEHYVDPKTTDDFLKLVPNAGLILPLHVFELLHGSGITEFMSYKNMLEELSNGKRFMPLIWGESFEL